MFPDDWAVITQRTTRNKMAHLFPIDALEERVRHNVTEACCRMAAQALNGVLLGPSDQELRGAADNHLPVIL